MKHLDERIIITVSGFTVKTSGLYTYSVYSNDGDVLLFTGNTYLIVGSSFKDFDITDIVRNTAYLTD